MTSPGPQAIIGRIWWLEFGFAMLSTLILGSAIVFGGDPATILGAAVICVAIVALYFRHVSLLAAICACAVLVGMVEISAQGGAGPFAAGPVIAVCALAGFIGLAASTISLHEETGVPLHLCFFVVLPIGRLIGLASALWVLAHSAAPFVASMAASIGLRAVAIGALVVPVVLSEVLKFSLKPLYVAQVKS